MNLREAAMLFGLKNTYAICSFKYSILLFIERVKKENDVFRLNSVQNIVIGRNSTMSHFIHKATLQIITYFEENLRMAVVHIFCPTI